MFLYSMVELRQRAEVEVRVMMPHNPRHAMRINGRAVILTITGSETSAKQYVVSVSINCQHPELHYARTQRSFSFYRY